MGMILIKRADNLGNFTQVPNNVIRGKILTIEGLGMLTYLLSHDANFQLNRATVSKAFPKNGETKIRSVLQELEEAGYLRREKLREDKSGTFARSVWVISVFGDLNQIQEEMPLVHEEEPALNLELFPGDPAAAVAMAASRSNAAPALNASEFLAKVIDAWHAMITVVRPVDVFKVQYQRPRPTPPRLRAIRARMKEPDWMEQWKDAITRIGKIEGLHGRVADRDGRTFTCDLDWFLKPGTVNKVMEGKYDNWVNKTPALAAESVKKVFTGGV